MAAENQIIRSEINLREIIEILLRGKVFIIAITIIAILAAAAVGFFFTPVSYEAEATLLASPFDLDTILSDKADNQIIDYLTKLPSMTKDTYLHQIVSEDVLIAAIEKIDLHTDDGQVMSASLLASAVQASSISGTNLISVSVRNSDPDLAAKIANTIATCFIDYINTNTNLQSQQSVDLIAEQMSIVESNLNEKSLALAEFQKNNRNINLLTEEISGLTEQIVEYSTQLNDLDMAIARDQSALRALLNSIEKTPGINLSDFTIIVQLDEIVSEPESVLQVNLGTDNLSVALLKVELNKIQTRLIVNINERTALINNLEKMNKALTQDQITLTEQEYKYNSLTRDLEMAESAYEAYLLKYKDATLTAAANIGETIVQISSIALPPRQPLNSNRLFKVVIAGILGFIISIVTVLFLDYWKKSKPV